MKLDEIDENYENLKAKVVSYPTNKTEQARGGQKEMHVPMEVDHVSGREPEEEDRKEVDGSSKGIDMLQLRDDGTLREGLL